MQQSDYHQLIARKAISFKPRGLDKVPPLNPAMFDHQMHSTEFALRAGCAALFLDTGLGKSFCALEFGRIIVEHTNKPVLMLAPLAVGPQHQRGRKNQTAGIGTPRMIAQRKTYGTPETVEATLTTSERTSPFRLAEPDNDPLPKITRVALEIVGNEYTERVVPSLQIVGRGSLPGKTRSEDAV